MADVEIPEAKDPFERIIALSIAILAVVLAFVDNTGNNGQADAIVKTNLASNQWAYYQAKSIKGSIAESNVALLTSLSDPAKPEIKTKIDELTKNVERYDAEKKEIKDKAEALQKEAAAGQAIDDQCDVASLFLQIAVVICSIAVLVRWKAIFFAGLGMGLVGIYEAVIAFMM